MDRRDYDSSNQGFRIRGMARQGGDGPRRPYHDVDEPRRRERDSGHYGGRRIDDRLRHNDYYHANDGADQPFSWDEPEEPPARVGDEDVGETPSQFLLIRGLKANVDETILGKGLEKLYLDPEDAARQSPPPPPSQVLPPGANTMPTRPSQSGAVPGSLKRVLLIRDRVTEKSMMFGFAEFHSSSDAEAALSKAKALGEKCTISSKTITIGYPHLGVFPHTPLTKPNEDPKYHFELKPGTSHHYYYADYWASILVMNANSPHQPTDTQPSQRAMPKQTKKRPIPPVDIPDGFGSEKAKKPKNSTAPLAIAEMWQKKQAELRGEEVETSDHDTGNPTGAAGANHDSGTDPTTQSFVFEGQLNGKHQKCCFLCMTQLGASINVEDHVKRSEKHAQNLKDDAKYRQGFENLKKRGLKEDDTVAVESAKVQQPEYKDRAKERRQEEAKMGVSNAGKIKLSLKGAQGKKESSKPIAPSYGKGLNMLQKAGWKEGQGLGSGDGVAAPIEQSMYAAGVGLGHESSKKGDAVEEAARLTKDDGGSFLEKTREAARERFERMG